MNSFTDHARPSVRASRLGAGLALVMACSQLECAREPTALIVVIDADPAVMSRLMPPRGALLVTVSSGAGTLIRQEIFPQAGRMLPIPLTFAISQGSNSSNTKILVEVEGYAVDPMEFRRMLADGGRPQGQMPIIHARVIAPFVRDQVKVVPIPLRGACVGQMPCPPGLTCIGPRVMMPNMRMPSCESAELSAEELNNHTPTVENRCPDGGLRVGAACESPGMMPTDGGAMPMPPDAGPPPDNGPPPPQDAAPIDIPTPIDVAALVDASDSGAD